MRFEYHKKDKYPYWVFFSDEEIRATSKLRNVFRWILWTAIDSIRLKKNLF